jgi:hypothetical protein
MKAIPMDRKYFFGVLAALVLALSACGKKEEPRKSEPIPPPTSGTAPAAPAGVAVTAVTLGNAVGADKKVKQTTDSFGAKDTIYASVDTAGAGTATLKAKWTYLKNGQETLVKEDTQTIVPTGPATSEFHISKPDGWPKGEYRVEISAAGKPAGTKTFTVK